MIPLRDENPTHRRAIVTLVLIALNVAIYFGVQPSVHDPAINDFVYEYAAVPCEVVTNEPISQVEFATGTCNELPEGEPRFPGKSVFAAVLISMFLHGSFMHLAGNMLFLWVFGNNIEDHLGGFAYLAFYVFGGILATVAHVAVDASSTIPVVGASGAIAGVMGAYLVWFPNAPVRTVVLLGFFVLFPQIRAKWLLGFWFVSQFFVNPNEGVAWMAHVGGFVFGALAGLLLAAVRPRPSPAPRW